MIKRCPVRSMCFAHPALQMKTKTWKRHDVKFPKTWILYQLRFGGCWEREVAKMASTLWHENWKDVKEWMLEEVRGRVNNRSWSLVMTTVESIWLAADLNWILACSPPSQHDTALQELQTKQVEPPMYKPLLRNAYFLDQNYQVYLLHCPFIYDFPSDPSCSGQPSGMFLREQQRNLAFHTRRRIFLKSWATTSFSIIFFEPQLID